MYPQNIQYTNDLLISVFAYIDFKLLASGLFSIASFFFGASLQNMALVALFTLIIFDSISGISAAYRTGVQIESVKILRTVIKICIYFLFVSAGHLCDMVTQNILPIENTIIAFLAVTELVSIMENIGKMGYVVPQTLLNKLKEIRDSK